MHFRQLIVISNDFICKILMQGTVAFQTMHIAVKILIDQKLSIIADGVVEAAGLGRPSSRRPSLRKRSN